MRDKDLITAGANRERRDARTSSRSQGAVIAEVLLGLISQAVRNSLGAAAEQAVGNIHWNCFSHNQGFAAVWAAAERVCEAQRESRSLQHGVSPKAGKQGIET